MQRLTLVLSALLLAPPAQAAVSSPYPGVTLVDHPEAVLAVIDLCAPGVSLRSTRYAERQATPQQWGQQVDAELAINGDFFQFPGWSWVVGRARGAGEEWPGGAQQLEPVGFWQFGPGRADYEPDPGVAPLPWITELMGSRDLLVVNGVVQTNWPNDDFFLGPHRRTAVGISPDRQTLFMLVTRASVGFPQTGQWMVDFAAEVGAKVDLGTNLDGGGSSQMYVKGQGQIVTSGRQVTNHLGVYAKGGGTPGNCRSRTPNASGNIASWGPGRLDVFERGTDDALKHRGFGPAWWGWDSLGGKLAETPVVTSWGPNRLDVFAVTEDRALHHLWWDGVSFSGWEPQGGGLLSAPAVTSWGPNRIDLFAVGLDGAMLHKAWTGLAWTGWEDLGGKFVHQPAVVSWASNRLDVFGVSAEDGSLQHLYWNGTQFSAWESLGGSLSSAPAVTAWGFNRLDIFARGAEGDLVHKAWTGFGWTQWDALGGSLEGAPAVVAWAPNRLDVFAKMVDGTLGHLWWSGAAFSGWEPHLGQIDAAPTAVSWAPNRLDIFSVRGDRQVVHKAWNGQAWTGWEALGGAVKKPEVALGATPREGDGPVIVDLEAGRPGARRPDTSRTMTAEGGCAAAPAGAPLTLVALLGLRRRRA